MVALDFSTVLYGVAQLAGQDRDNMPDFLFKQVRDLANSRLCIAWESEYWPELLKNESITVSDTAGVAPYFYNLPDTVGEVLGVYDKDPNTTTKKQSVSWHLDHDGTNRRIILRSATTPVYIEYRVSRPELKGDVWQDASNNKGAQVYYETDGVGNFYKSSSQISPGDDEPFSVTAATGAIVEGAKWDKDANIPKIFQGFLIRGVYADYLRADNQREAAMMEDNAAESMLHLEADKLYRQQGQVRQSTIMTY